MHLEVSQEYKLSHLIHKFLTRGTVLEYQNEENTMYSKRNVFEAKTKEFLTFNAIFVNNANALYHFVVQSRDLITLQIVVRFPPEYILAFLCPIVDTSV